MTIARLKSEKKEMGGAMKELKEEAQEKRELKERLAMIELEREEMKGELILA